MHFRGFNAAASLKLQAAPVERGGAVDFRGFNAAASLKPPLRAGVNTIPRDFRGFNAAASLKHKPLRGAHRRREQLPRF